jgi:spermidine synthase
MNHSLFIEQRKSGLAFYIDGDLQFDTEDEAIYHEYLVIPAIALAQQRFPDIPLRVLICGGGDGLAARDVLRFPQVDRIDLVDFSPDTIEYGRTIFKPFNQGSFESKKLAVYEREAFEFVADLTETPNRELYHVIICDFTCPNRLEETRIYSREWYEKLYMLLHPGGFVSINAVSPQLQCLGFWCLYQTLRSVNYSAQPLQLSIPSFQDHEYGLWGFILASTQPILPTEISAIVPPESCQIFQLEALYNTFLFEQSNANLRHHVRINTLESPQLFYYLLNPQIPAHLLPQSDETKTIDFLTFDDSENGAIAESPTRENLLQLESLSKRWIEQFHRLKNTDRLSEASPESLNLDLAELFPVQHRYHEPKMTEEWASYLKQLLAEIDLSRLLSSLLKRSQQLPEKVVKDLQDTLEKLRSDSPLDRISPQMAELILLLSTTLLMANLVVPDVAFAKGYVSTDETYPKYYRLYNDTYYVQESYTLSAIGFLLMLVSGYWMYRICNPVNKKNNSD